jgi:CheY-like chemotaxis protein
MATILVIEDVPAVLLSLRIVLQGAPHRVTGAANGVLGLGLLKDTTFDLVITDIWMPGSSGKDVIREGRQRSPRTRFLAITDGDPNGTAMPDDLRGHDFGADQVLLKPFEKATLLRTVAQLLPAPDPACMVHASDRSGLL